MPFFQRESAGGPGWLVVGLGNPEKKYERTRHNTGFMALDAIADAWSVSVTRKKFEALVGEGTAAGERVLLMKPQTYMNLSGAAVEKAASFYKIPPERILVLFDDISLPPGKLRIRRKGSHGGHNGIRSIVDYLQSDAFPRVKLGVGEKSHPDYDLADWVLSAFKSEELEEVQDAAARCPEIAALIVKGRIDEAMNRFNS